MSSDAAQRSHESPGSDGADADPHIDVARLSELRASGEPHHVLDVREAWERDIAALEPSLHVPMADLPTAVDSLPRDRTLVVICHSGVRSHHATAWLRASGFDRAVNLRGGIDAWATQIDPTMRRY